MPGIPIGQPAQPRARIWHRPASYAPAFLLGGVVLAIGGTGETRFQVERGAATFDKRCSHCHAKDLSGGQGPALTGDPFVAEWAGKSARALYSRILLSMPLDDPGSLQPQQAMELAAFIISVNQFQSPETAFSSPAQMSKVTLRVRQ